MPPRRAPRLPSVAAASPAAPPPLYPLPYRLPADESPEALDARARALLRPRRGFGRATAAEVRHWLQDPVTAELAFQRLPWLGLPDYQITSAREAGGEVARHRLGHWPDEANSLESFLPQARALIGHLTASAAAGERGWPAWNPLTEGLWRLTNGRAHYDREIQNGIEALVKQHVLPWIAAHAEAHWDLVAPLLRRPEADLLRRGIAVEGQPISDAVLGVLTEFPEDLHVRLGDVCLTDAQRNRVVANTLAAMEADPDPEPGISHRVRLLWTLSTRGWSRVPGPVTDPAILATMRRLAEGDLPEYQEFLGHWTHHLATSADLDALWDRLLEKDTAALAASHALTAAQAERLLAFPKRRATILGALAGNRARLRDPAVVAALVGERKLALMRAATFAMAPDPAALPYFAQWLELEPNSALRSLLHIKSAERLPKEFRRMIPPELLTPAAVARDAATRELVPAAITVIGPDVPTPAPKPAPKRRAPGAHRG